MKADDMDERASLIADGLAPEADLGGVAARVTHWRSRWSGVHFTA
jgi:glycine hydroxymethyltransferase